MRSGTPSTSRKRLTWGLLWLGLSLAVALACSSDKRFRSNEADSTPDVVEAGGAGGMGGAGDAGAGGESPARPELVLDEPHLPDAWFNIDYSATAAARGGTGDGYAFSIASGELPGGLTLDSSGRLRGVPNETGSFTFAIRVTDSEDNAASVETTLTVRQKRYLAYVSDEQNDGQYHLYLVDLTTELRTKVRVTQLPSIDLPRFTFSPDGSKLAFTQTVDDLWMHELFVVDLSGPELEPAISLGEIREHWSFLEVQWDTSSHWLAWASNVGSEESPSYSVYASRFSEGNAQSSVIVGDSIDLPVRTLKWVNDSLVTFRELGGALVYVRRNENEFGVPQRLDLPLAIVRANPTDETAVGSMYDGCGNVLQESIVDFADLSSSPLAECSSATRLVSPDMKWISDVDYGGGLWVYPSESIEDGEPVFESSEASGIQWAPNSKFFAARLETAEGSRVVLVDPDEAEIREFSFDWSQSALELWTPAFSPDARWLRFSSGQETYLAATGGGEAGTIVGAIPGATQASVVGTDPQSRFLVGLGKLDASQTEDLFLVELLDDGPGQPRKISHWDTGVSGKTAISTDSAWVAYAYRDGSTSDSPLRLYLVDLLDPDGVGVGLGSTWPHSAAVETFTFQP